MPHEQPDKSEQEFGELISVYKARLEWITALWIFFAVTLLVSGAAIIAEHYFGAVCIIFAIPFLYLAWAEFVGRSDELRLYSKGFVYKTRSEVHRGRWADVEDLMFTTTRNYNYKVGVSASMEEAITHDLTAVIERNGSVINIKPGIVKGTEVIGAIKTFLKLEAADRRKDQPLH